VNEKRAVIGEPGPKTDVLTFGPFTLKVSCSIDPNNENNPFAWTLPTSTDPTAEAYLRTLGDGTAMSFSDPGNFDSAGDFVATFWAQ
jgi:hypothetical protein